MHCPKTKTLRASSRSASGSVMSRSRRSACETSVTNAFLATIDGMSSNIASHSCGSIPRRGDHVQQRVGVDVLLVRVAAEHELELGRRDELAHDADDVVADDPLGGGEVADAHAHDPAVDLGQGARIAPLLDVLAHLDVLGLPVVGLHRAVELVGPAVAQREQVEGGVSRPPTTRLAASAASALALSSTKVRAPSVYVVCNPGLLKGRWEEAEARRLSFSPRTFQRAREQSTGLGRDGPLPLRDSAGISPDFAGIRAVVRGRYEPFRTDRSAFARSRAPRE